MENNDEHVPSWRKTSQSLGGTPPEPFNKHLNQLHPSTAKRNPLLDEAIKRKREEESERLPSGHSLIRHGQQARWVGDEPKKETT